jgi:transcriptional regulator with XRE-family HTH domain
VTAGSGSVFVRKALGRRLKVLRLAAGKTFADVADVGSAAKMKRIEAGEPPIRMPDVRTLCFMYGADGATTEQLVEMALNKDEDWWEYYHDVVPTWLGKYVALESASSSMTTFDPELIHGLLQTPAYHRAIYLSDQTLRPGDLERQLSLRADRQRAAFGRTPPFRITAVLGEGALLRVVGGPETMAEQRAHLLKLTVDHAVEVFVLPWSAGAHSAMTGAFTMLRNDSPDDPDVVYLETLSGGRYIEKQDIVERYRTNAAILQSQAVTLKEYLS